jgi:hypothetical protein
LAVSHFGSGNSQNLSTLVLKEQKRTLSSSFNSTMQNNIKAARKTQRPNDKG